MHSILLKTVADREQSLSGDNGGGNVDAGVRESSIDDAIVGANVDDAKSGVIADIGGAGTGGGIIGGAAIAFCIISAKDLNILAFDSVIAFMEEANCSDCFSMAIIILSWDPLLLIVD